MLKLVPPPEILESELPYLSQDVLARVFSFCFELFWLAYTQALSSSNYVIADTSYLSSDHEECLEQQGSTEASSEPEIHPHDVGDEENGAYVRAEAADGTRFLHHPVLFDVAQHRSHYDDCIKAGEVQASSRSIIYCYKDMNYHRPHGDERIAKLNTLIQQCTYPDQ